MSTVHALPLLEQSERTSTSYSEMETRESWEWESVAGGEVWSTFEKGLLSYLALDLGTQGHVVAFLRAPEFGNVLWPFWSTERPGQVYRGGFPASSTSLVETNESVLRDLREQGVRVHHPGSVLDYLTQYPGLVDVLPKAVAAARAHFPEAQLVMDLYQDPEIEDRYLVLYVRLKAYDDSVLERLEQAESAFIHLLEGTEGWLQLTTDFRVAEDKDAL